MGNFKILLKKNLIEMVRNKRLIVFSIVFLSISLFSALTAKVLPGLIDWLFESLGQDGSYISTLLGGDTVAGSYMQFISMITDVGLLLIIIFFVGTLIKEKKTGTYDVLKMKERDIGGKNGIKRADFARVG